MKCVIKKSKVDGWMYYDSLSSDPFSLLYKGENCYLVVMRLTKESFRVPKSILYKDLISEIRKRRVAQLESIWISDLEDKGYSEFEINMMIQDRINEYLNHN